MKIIINQDATVCQRGNQTEFMIKTLVSKKLRNNASQIL